MTLVPIQIPAWLLVILLSLIVTYLILECVKIVEKLILAYRYKKLTAQLKRLKNLDKKGNEE